MNLWIVCHFFMACLLVIFSFLAPSSVGFYRSCGSGRRRACFKAKSKRKMERHFEIVPGQKWLNEIF